MVVDSNFLQRDELRDYLSAAPDNHAVLTDYAAIEAYKGETLKSIFRSMEILTAFPKQVIILKGTQVICGMSGRAEAVQESLVDKTQTRDFSAYCRDLLAAKNGDLSFQQGLLEHGREASAHMDRVLQDMPLLSSGFALMAQEYTLAELKNLRERGELSSELRTKLVQNVVGLATQLSANFPSSMVRSRSARMRDAFLFRYALCTHILIVKASGGTPKTNREKLRNDMVDVNFATFATYFDGLMTADKKAAEIFADADFLLRDVFALPPWPVRAFIPLARGFRLLLDSLRRKNKI